MYTFGNPLKYNDPSGHDPQCDVGTSACDTEWGLWRQYEQSEATWSSWEDFKQGYSNYAQYAANPDSYIQDWRVRAGFDAGDRQSTLARLALAENYSASVLGQEIPVFFDPNYPLGAAYQSSDGSNTPIAAPPIIVIAVGTFNANDPLFQPGPYANPKGSIPATGPRVTASQRASIQPLGDSYGCHSCGAQQPGGSGVWVGDHQPPTSMANGAPQRLYPQCQACSNRQGGLLSWINRQP